MLDLGFDDDLVEARSDDPAAFLLEDNSLSHFRAFRVFRSFLRESHSTVPGYLHTVEQLRATESSQSSSTPFALPPRPRLRRFRWGRGDRSHQHRSK